MKMLWGSSRHAPTIPVVYQGMFMDGHYSTQNIWEHKRRFYAAPIERPSGLKQRLETLELCTTCAYYD